MVRRLKCRYYDDDDHIFHRDARQNMIEFRFLDDPKTSQLIFKSFAYVIVRQVIDIWFKPNVTFECSKKKKMIDLIGKCNVAS